MKAGIWEPNWNDALGKLSESGILPAAQARDAKRGYEFLRRCESALRRWENKTVSTLPSEPSEQRKLAVRLGCEGLDAFREQYVDARETIHALYNRLVKSAAG